MTTTLFTVAIKPSQSKSQFFIHLLNKHKHGNMEKWLFSVICLQSLIHRCCFTQAQRASLAHRNVKAAAPPSTSGTCMQWISRGRTDTDWKMFNNIKSNYLVMTSHTSLLVIEFDWSVFYDASQPIVSRIHSIPQQWSLQTPNGGLRTLIAPL